jgi:cytochrome c-type biogenesis protein CcmF
VGALVARRTGSEWVQLSRRWTLAVWTFLTIGIMLGGAWAYMELGWGGYWGWDPVENASFLPWLAGTAFIHSVMIQERRGMLKVWNMILVGLFFGLSIFGTFLTRSGVISSVHSFAQSALGPYFLSFISVVFLGFLWLLFSRWDDLRSTNQLESMISRESSFILNNLLFIAITFTVFWGTIFPMISEIVVGDKITVGPPFFDQTTAPIFAALILLMGIGPVTSWGRASIGKLARNLAGPFVGTGVIVATLFALGLRSVALWGFAMVIFVLFVHLMEFYHGARVYRSATRANWFASILALFRRNRRRYGGYVVHLGILVITTGIIASYSYQLEHQETVAPGGTMQVGEYSLTYQGMRQFALPDRDVAETTILVNRGGRQIDTLFPSRDFYRNSDQPQTEVAIRRTLAEDLYIVLGGWEEGGQTATFKVYVNSLVNWIWLGGAVVILGVLIAAWPEARRQTVASRVTEGVPIR